MKETGTKNSVSEKKKKGIFQSILKRKKKIREDNEILPAVFWMERE